jgi:hypothetical protein
MTTLDELLAQGIAKIEAGDRQEGAALLAQAVLQNPRSEAGWFWLAAAVDDPARKRFCLKRALAINPASEQTQAALQQLEAVVEPAPALSETAAEPQHLSPVYAVGAKVSTPAAGLLTLSCPTCGAKLELTPDDDRFACPSCGNEHIVLRSGPEVVLKPVLERLDRVQEQVSATSAVVLSQQYKSEMDRLEKEGKAAWQTAGRGLFAAGIGGIFLLINFVFVRWDVLVNLGVILIAVGAGLGLLGWVQLRSISRRKEELNQRQIDSLN